MFLFNFIFKKRLKVIIHIYGVGSFKYHSEWGRELEILCEGGGLPNGGAAILEGGVLTLDETMYCTEVGEPFLKDANF